MGDPWHKPTDAEEIARYRDQQAGLTDFLAREAAMTPREKAEEDVEQLADSRSPFGWGALAVVALGILAALAAIVGNACQ